MLAKLKFKYWVFTFCFCLTGASYAKPTLNAALIHAMQTYHVPVVGYAIIANNKIIVADTLSIDPKIKVTKNSIFQAASISKSVSAYGALKLVAQHKLDLDQSVNSQLTSWQIPTNKFNKHNPVTLRELLTMTSGLSVSGFPGHEQDQPLPTLKEILEGKPRANTAPIRVFYSPGTKYYYSGGAFQVLQQLVEDTTQQPFSTWMNKEVLQPLEMQHSIFQYPLNTTLRAQAIPGFNYAGTMIKKGWNNYAVAGAGGLWSTPTDLAKFALNITISYHANGFLPKTLATEMLTRQKNTDYGLGVVVNGSGRTLNFRKAGHNLGYHSQLLMFPNTGDGIVVMTNSENGEYVINYFIALVAKQNKWPCYFPFFDELISIPDYAC